MTNKKSFLAISFSKGFISPNIPIATFHQGDKELNFIIDTGSDNNIIDSNVLPELQYEMVEDKMNLTGLGGSREVGICNIVFSYEDEEYSTPFLISDMKEAFNMIRECHAIPIHGMLGSKFLKRQNIILDFNKMVAYNKA
jgi:predicted aspartyl protease